MIIHANAFWQHFRMISNKTVCLAYQLIGPEQNGHHFAGNVFKSIFFNENYVSIGLVNGSVLFKCQVVIWTNTDIVHWRICVTWLYGVYEYVYTAMIWYPDSAEKLFNVIIPFTTQLSTRVTIPWAAWHLFYHSLQIETIVMISCDCCFRATSIMGKSNPPELSKWLIIFWLMISMVACQSGWGGTLCCLKSSLIWGWRGELWLRSIHICLLWPLLLTRFNFNPSMDNLEEHS